MEQAAEAAAVAEGLRQWRNQSVELGAAQSQVNKTHMVKIVLFIFNFFLRHLSGLRPPAYGPSNYAKEHYHPHTKAALIQCEPWSKCWTCYTVFVLKDESLASLSLMATPW